MINKITEFIRSNIVIIGIVFLGAILRMYSIGAVPPALNSDEVAIGYNAYSILRTGRDEYNQKFPLTFRSFDDYKMPVYVYLTALSIKFFGYNDAAVRIPSALAGTLTVLCTYLLVLGLFGKKQKKYALVSALLFALSPWSIMFSRSGYEANVAVFFVVTGMCLFLAGLKKGILLIVSGLSFSLAIWTYLSARLFVPLLLVSLGIVFFRSLVKQKVIVFVTVVSCGLILYPVIRMSLSPEGQIRARGVSAFENPDVVHMVEQNAQWIQLDKRSVISAVIHNRRVEYLQTVLRGYFSHFDLNFLFMDRAVEKYRAPGMGLLYLFELPLLFVGIYRLIRNRSTGTYVIFSWTLIAPVAASFTSQLPHPVRTLVFLPMFQIISAIGFVDIYDYMQSLRGRTYIYRFIMTIFIAGAVVNIYYFMHQYFIHMPVDYSRYWYTGRKEMVEKLKKIEGEYDNIYISNKLDFPYIFYLYYAKIDPSVYLSSGGTKSGGFKEEGNIFGKYEFRTISLKQTETDKKILFVSQPADVFSRKLIIDTIYYPDGKPAINFFK